jgi:EAL domain-containing protein (putative c-di-GMP-specific phosphodiesterase class I)
MPTVRSIAAVDPEIPRQRDPAGEPLKAKIVRVLESRRLACEYQPIVDAETERVWGYESLARFVLDGQEFAPNEVFDSLHDDRTLFFGLESRAKTFQIEHRPKKSRLFLNLDPHVCEEPYQLDHWLDAFGGQSDLVIEIIENTTITNLENIQRFTATLAECGIQVALDDVGGSRNLFSFDLLETCNYVKLDRRWFVRLEKDAAYRSLISGIVQFSKARGIAVVLEGVESRRHLSIAKTLGVDFVQGYLFRDGFLSVSDSA